MRHPRDELAWEAIRVSREEGEVKVVLLQGAAGDQPPPGVTVLRSPPVEYDEIVEMMEWADKVVVW